MPIPNHNDCQECSDWDNVNACWQDQEDIFSCPKYSEIHEQDCE